jgi:DNA primase
VHQDLTWALTHGSGVERSFLCPVHGDTNPSASVNVLKGLWICYSCGAKGTLDSVLTDNQQMDAVNELVRALAEDLEPVHYTESWLNQFDSGPVHAYWIKRFGYAAIKHFRLGFDPTGAAVTYPLRSPGGRVLGVVRRRLDDAGGGPKYKYPFGIDVSDLLFNYSADARPVVYLVEGALDAVACWEAGVEAFAVYGARISTRQLELLDRTGALDVVCVFDQDEAGETAYEQVKELARGRFVHRMSWDRALGKDVAELPLSTRLDQFEKVRQDLLGSPTCESSSPLPSKTLRLRAGRMPSATTSKPGHLRIVR